MKYIILCLLLVSCSASQRAYKHLQKAKELGAIITSDTVYIVKTVVVPEYKWDTVAMYQTLMDTFIINTEKVKTRIKVDTVTKTMFIDQIVKGDTIFIEVPVKVDTNIHPPPKGINPWPWIIAVLVLVVIILILRK